MGQGVKENVPHSCLFIYLVCLFYYLKVQILNHDISTSENGVDSTYCSL